MEDGNGIGTMTDRTANMIELAKQRKLILQHERRNALKRSSLDIRVEEKRRAEYNED